MLNVKYSHLQRLQEPDLVTARLIASPLSAESRPRYYCIDIGNSLLSSNKRLVFWFVYLFFPYNVHFNWDRNWLKKLKDYKYVLDSTLYAYKPSMTPSIVKVARIFVICELAWVNIYLLFNVIQYLPGPGHFLLKYFSPLNRDKYCLTIAYLWQYKIICKFFHS